MAKVNVNQGGWFKRAGQLGADGNLHAFGQLFPGNAEVLADFPESRGYSF